MNVLVLGGTGPTGPYVINGLLSRGYEVTIMHGGFHEVEFDGPVEDLHGDVHFKESLQETLGDRTFDTVISMYGRMKDTAEFMVGRTGRFIGIGAIGARSDPRDPEWGPLGRLFAPDEESMLPPLPGSDGLPALIVRANDRVMELHGDGHFNASIIAYPALYGPRQIAPEDWSVVRRILDGRRQLIIADGGLKIHQRGYVENVAEAVLLTVDKPTESAGELFLLGEQPLYTMRQRIELICRTLDWEMEFVDMPFPLARPSHYLWFHGPRHWVWDDSKIRRVLGYREKVPIGEAQIRTVHWLVENSATLRGEWEEQMEDSFDYEAEDVLIKAWEAAYREVAGIEIRSMEIAHRYRHPKVPGEPWRRPARTSDAPSKAGFNASPEYF